ncbi:AEC family transporter [Levilactobacillus fujinensis]|uniref:AEC family transporter n=1 Tax=Levilactobacillus fujinensis TaxID=2486024 RepID=A0ABW1TFT6_9LACO|nr:AEC family transporter [Levilactobacillus fujinensis]
MDMGQLTSQITLMFILMAIGLLINKLGFMHGQTATDLTNILLYVVSPCLIVNAFEQRFSVSRLQALAWVMLGILLTYGVMVIVTHLVFKHVADTNLQRIMRFGSVYSNAGFMGVPLASALFGSNGVFFAVASLAGFNIFCWTHGITLFTPHKTGDRRINWHQILLNPNIVAIAVGLLIFVSGLHLPSLLNQTITYVSSINTPLSMIVIGNSLAAVKLNRHTLDHRLWGPLLLRNLLFPIIMLLILRLFGVQGIPLYTTVLMGACPVAGNVVLFTLQAHGDTSPAVTLMSLSTILCLVTIPLIFTLSNLI